MFNIMYSGKSKELGDNHGITILVTCDYASGNNVPKLEGTKIDAEKMEKTFKEREFVMYKLQNKDATKQNIKECVREVQQELQAYHREAKDKVIIFAFSGHGTSKDSKEYIYDNKGEGLCVMDDIIRPLVTHRNPKAEKIPVLFLLDACRGAQHIDGADCTEGKKGPPSQEVEQYFGGIVDQIAGNFRIDFCTIPAHVSYCIPGEGSVWMPKLAVAMREKNGPFPDIADEVKKEVHESPKVKELKIEQQCESVCSITSGILYLSKNHDEIPGNCLLYNANTCIIICN